MVSQQNIHNKNKINDNSTSDIFIKMHGVYHVKLVAEYIFPMFLSFNLLPNVISDNTSWRVDSP